MANTYTDLLKMRMPALGDPGWDDEINDNTLIIEVLLATAASGNSVLSGLAPSDGGVLDVDYAAGSVYVAGVRYAVGAGSKTCTANLKNWLYVDSSGVVQIATVVPTGQYVSLALVDAGAATITRIADLRFNRPVSAAKAQLENGLIINLKLAVNAAVNKLDVFSKTGGAVPDAANIITIAIPDGSGNTFRSRAAAYLSGTSQFILADAANYWSKGSLDAEIKTAYVYAIWDGTGIVWALAGYAGFDRVPTTTTVTDDDYFLLEDSSTYVRSNDHHCVCVGKIRYQYDTADTPDHTIQATVIDAPQAVWNHKSDYGYQKNFPTTSSGGADQAEAALISIVAKQSGKYKIQAKTMGIVTDAGTYISLGVFIRVGSATYASATQKSQGKIEIPAISYVASVLCVAECYVNAGESIHFGGSVLSDGGVRILYGDSSIVGASNIVFNRAD